MPRLDNKKKALLFLTRDPKLVMEFYGLDVARYSAGFKDENDLFDWASSGRLFSHHIFETRVEKSNDRSRQAKRPMYQRFVEEFMPAHTGKGATNVWTRQQVLQEALNTFGKHAEYDFMMQQHGLKEAEEDLWKEIRAAIPAEGNSLGLALKGLKRWVLIQNGEPYITTEPNLGEYTWWAISMEGRDRTEVLDWVRIHWEEVKTLEKAWANAAKEATKTG